jgi:hypothetical protein
MRVLDILAAVRRATFGDHFARGGIDCQDFGGLGAGVDAQHD